MKFRSFATSAMIKANRWIMIALVIFGAAKAHAAGAAKYVVHISVDGLGSSYLQLLVNEDRLPNFKRLQQEGAWTNNARTDFDYTITLPNHTCMVTGRPVMDKATSPAAVAGHGWTHNSDPGDKTLHLLRHEYVKSTFDVAHDHGLHTGLFPSKSKFVLYNQSYDEKIGAPDTVGDDNGRDKIDAYVKDGNTAKLMEAFEQAMKEKPLEYSFVHFHNTDSAGHSKGWGSPAYNDALKAVDGHLGTILQLIDSDERLKGHTAIILSADHGGYGLDHGNNRNPLNYTIPFYTWGAGVAAGQDLYALNKDTRRDPLSNRPDYIDSGLPPIRNGDGANLAMTLLGLPAVPDSLIDVAQNLKTQ